MQNFRSKAATDIEEEAEAEADEEDEEFYLYSVPGVTFSSIFLLAVTFLHVLHLDVIKRQIEIETESKN